MTNCIDSSKESIKNRIQNRMKSFIKNCKNSIKSSLKVCMDQIKTYMISCMNYIKQSIKICIKNSIKNSKVLFQENILEFCEGANVVIFLLNKIPKVRNKVNTKLFAKEKIKERNKFGVFALICAFILEFLKKLVYAIIFVYIPYKLLGKVVVNVLNNQEISIIYFFIIMTTLCGSITNNTMFSMSDRDYIMLRVMLVKSNIHYFGRILYKMITELVYFTIILMILGVNFKYSIAVSLFTMAMRPLGEFISLLIHDNAAKVHAMRGSINGVIMAGAFIAAYVLPYVNRAISNTWYRVSNPYFLIGILLICVATMWFLWTYKNYEQVAQDAVYIRREDKL